MVNFEWDAKKDILNQAKHGIAFSEAQEAFFDKKRIIRPDEAHSKDEPRHYCFGKVKGGIVTVRFTHRKDKIRIFGAAYWREGRKLYEQNNL